VGEVLNLAVWFGIHVLVPDGHTPDLFAIALTAIAFVGMMKWKRDIIAVVGGASALGLLRWMLGW
jgi:chromate transporter